jgi:DNA modification methylase
MTKTTQLALWPIDKVQEEKDTDRATTTFIDNMKLPVHGWFRFSAGFSAEWIEAVIRDVNLSKEAVLFDPFAGSGTTVLAGETAGIKSIGLEAHPFVYRVANAKLHWDSNVNDFRDLAHHVLKAAKNNRTNSQLAYPPLIHKCYPDEALSKLDALKTTWEIYEDNSNISELVWLALTSVLRVSSPVGTSNMELIQPKKRKSNNLDPFDAFTLKIDSMYKDMLTRQNMVEQSKALIYNDDARICDTISTNFVDMVITSPPYANNFDYADATRLEMTFWNEIQGWKDLQPKIRKHLIRSCTQHVSAEKIDLLDLLSDPDLDPIRDELEPICKKLGEIRLQRGGRKNYHRMVAAYFSDLAKVWKALRRVCKTNSLVCFVIGDSAPYGIYVPVDRWLGELAIAAGFDNYSFEKTRDRNIKWKNRKHSVLLKEGRLWVKG